MECLVGVSQEWKMNRLLCPAIVVVALAVVFTVALAVVFKLGGK